MLRPPKLLKKNPLPQSVFEWNLSPPAPLMTTHNLPSYMLLVFAGRTFFKRNKSIELWLCSQLVKLTLH